MSTTNTTTTNNNNKYQNKFVEIGANLLDERFTHGIYHGKQRHEPDLDAVLQRAEAAGVTHIILTAGTLQESQRAVQLVRDLRQKQQNQGKTMMFVGCTVGVHPTRCQQEFIDVLQIQDQQRQQQEEEAEEEGKDTPVSTQQEFSSSQDVLNKLKEIAIDGQSDQSVVSIGEIGLDYDRLEFCSKQVQQEYFHKQLETMMNCPQLQHLPLFLHNRNVGTDLVEALRRAQQQQQQQQQINREQNPYRGVVHSFDDTLEIAQEFLEMGFYIGLNGCSLKTEENLAVVKQLPLDKILLETDCPYCEIKPTHAGHKYIQTTWPKKQEKKFEMGTMVKARNEPCQIVQVAEVIAGVKGLSVADVADQCYRNSLQCYGWTTETLSEKSA